MSLLLLLFTSSSDLDEISSLIERAIYTNEYLYLDIFVGLGVLLLLLTDHFYKQVGYGPRQGKLLGVPVDLRKDGEVRISTTSRGGTAS